MASPIVRRKRLAAELRAIRESTGKSGERVATALGWSPSKITRYELARTGLRVADVAKLLDYYEVTGSRRAQLLQLAKEAERKGWWEDSGDDITADHQLYIGYEDEAASSAICHYEVVPGLLQTEEYARWLIANYGLIEPIAPAVIERLVKVRMRRQEVLEREPPVQLSAVLDESILRRRIGDERVMHHQLAHLADMADRPNVTIRILPLDAQHAVLGPSFVIFRFGLHAVAPIPDVVASEQLKSILIVEDEKEAHLHDLLFQALGRVSLDPAASRELILETAETCWSGGRWTAS
jgi:transcriptional regulator with XRE-family HTH domain